MRKLKSQLKKLNSTQRKIAIISLFTILSLTTYGIAYGLSGYDVRFYYSSPAEYEVNKRYYEGAFYLKKTWYVWLIYLSIIFFSVYFYWKKKVKCK